jgi:hypothetical protein
VSVHSFIFNNFTKKTQKTNHEREWSCISDTKTYNKIVLNLHWFIELKIQALSSRSRNNLVYHILRRYISVVQYYSPSSWWIIFKYFPAWREVVVTNMRGKCKGEHYRFVTRKKYHIIVKNPQQRQVIVKYFITPFDSDWCEYEDITYAFIFWESAWSLSLRRCIFPQLF